MGMQQTIAGLDISEPVAFENAAPAPFVELSLGISPRFQILTLKQIMAIELNWGRYGYQPAWTAMKLYRSIYREGKRFRIPDLDSIPEYTEKDVAFRGRVPFADAQYNDVFSGLRDIDAAAAECESLMLSRDGQYLTNVQVGNEYDIDDEGLELFMEFELERVLATQRLNDTPNAAIHYLLGLGTVQLFKGSHGDWDRMLRISSQLTRHGLQPMLHDPHAIIAHLSAKHAAAHGTAVQTPAIGTEARSDVQGSLFDDDAPSAAQATGPASPSAPVTEVQAEPAQVNPATRYQDAISLMSQAHGREFTAPTLPQMLAQSCTVLAKYPLMAHTPESFMQLWQEHSPSFLDESGPEASAYAPAVTVAYGVLKSSGLILNP